MRIVNIAQLSNHLGCHRTTIYRWVKNGNIPPPLKKLGDPRWDRDQVDAWLLGNRPHDQSPLEVDIDEVIKLAAKSL